MNDTIKNVNKSSLREEIVREGFFVSLRDSKGKGDLLWFRSEYRDEFEANLDKVIRFLQKQGLDEEDVYRITAIVGELGNNSFDHNIGRWPNGFIGNFVALRYNKEATTLEVVVIDLGIGFQKSLENNDPSPESETEAIKMGLAGVTGRVGEKRGNGLRTVKRWMKEYYKGEMRIQSNEGVVTVKNEKIDDSRGEKIVGTEVYLRLNL